MTLDTSPSDGSAADASTKKDRIVSELRQLILSGAIPRGARIQQDVVAAQFGVSITPVREALRQLVADGLAISEPHKGVTVPLVDIGDVEAVYVMRRLIEPFVFVRASRRLSRLDLEQGAALTDAMEIANLAGDAARVSVANRDFHFLFFERCAIPALVRRLEELWIAFPWDMLMSGDPVHGSVEEHRAILAAFENGDPNLIRSTVELHMERGYLRICEHLQGRPGPDPFES